MDKQLDPSFGRVEKALGTLLDSISKYNPSTIQAQELGNADAKLAKGLKDCMYTHTPHFQPIYLLYYTETKWMLFRLHAYTPMTIQQ